LDNHEYWTFVNTLWTLLFDTLLYLNNLYRDGGNWWISI